MIAPSKLGLPPRFSKWRRQQWDAVWHLTESASRHRVLVAPTGFGKSLVYMGYALLTGHRVCILTSTRSQQSQINRDFAACGVSDIRGAQNYECILPPPDGREERYRSANKGWCKAGVQCLFRTGGCSYFDAMRAATSSQIVVTNYSYWLHQGAYGEGLGGFDALILDEAHAAPEELSNFLSVVVQAADINLIGLGYPSVTYWRDWALNARHRIRSFIANEGQLLDNVIHWKHLLNSVERLLIGQTTDWVLERDQSGNLRWTIAYPGAYAEQYLFRNVPEIVYVSATVREKTLALLGVEPRLYDFREYKSSFPVYRRPIYFVPTVKLSKDSSAEDRRAWLSRIDEIVGPRLDRKGVIHCVSYERRDIILRLSQYRQYMMTHDRGQSEQAIEQLKQAKAPCILVSPSITTGIDLAYSTAEYQIIAKVPFPDISSPVVYARSQLDPQYVVYVTIMTLVQAAGRVMRAPDDRGETFVVDNNVNWLVRRAGKMVPRWFREAIRRVSSVPPAPIRLDLEAN